MKLFISADIEGCVGTTLASETHKETPEYRQFAKRMTDEVRIVCQAALEAGADEIVVKDGHGDATNIDFTAMPEGVTLIRGKSGHPYNMMFGLDETFDGRALRRLSRAGWKRRQSHQPYLYRKQQPDSFKRKGDERVYAQYLHSGHDGRAGRLYFRR